jgi:hypothetical protein
MSNVIPFPDAATQPRELLLEAVEDGMAGVAVLGFQKNGDDYVAISNLTVAQCVYLAELLKRRAMEAHD